jgi:hypothetical protein
VPDRQSIGQIRKEQMELTIEQGIPLFREWLIKRNLDHSQMCLICTSGKLYRSDEEVPYLTFDLLSIKPIEDVSLSAVGTCSNCGNQTTCSFSLMGR